MPFPHLFLVCLQVLPEVRGDGCDEGEGAAQHSAHQVPSGSVENSAPRL